LGKYFRTLITAEDVQYGKPNPEVFLLAAQALDLNPLHCVVFEDAPMGIEAALAGGMKAVGITSTHPKSVLAKAHLVIRRLDELDLDKLESLFA
jgi:beta-phosphoglucomutase-like phosphatase (HAD superfamily)